MSQPSVEVAEVGLPPIEVPRGERPQIAAGEFEARIAALIAAVEAECVVVYADREHAANLTYLCNFDPRFEEAILVLSGGGAPSSSARRASSTRRSCRSRSTSSAARPSA